MTFCLLKSQRIYSVVMTWVCLGGCVYVYVTHWFVQDLISCKNPIAFGDGGHMHVICGQHWESHCPKTLHHKKYSKKFMNDFHAWSIWIHLISLRKYIPFNFDYQQKGSFITFSMEEVEEIIFMLNGMQSSFGWKVPHAVVTRIMVHCVIV